MGDRFVEDGEEFESVGYLRYNYERLFDASEILMLLKNQQ